MKFQDLSIAIILDVETTGRAPRRDRIVEVKLLKYDFNRDVMLETYFQRFNPHIPIEFMAHQVNGLDNLALKDAPDFGDQAHLIKQFIGNFPIIGHRVAFDMAFFEAEFDRLEIRGIGLNPWLCTMENIPSEIQTVWPNHLSLQESVIRGRVDAGCFELPPQFIHAAKICGLALYFKGVEGAAPPSGKQERRLLSWRDIMERPFVFWVAVIMLFFIMLANV